MKNHVGSNINYTITVSQDKKLHTLLIYISFTEAIPSCDIISIYIYIYIYIYIHVIHNNSKTHRVKCYKLVVRGNMFRSHCGHLQANLYKSNAFNVRTIWDPTNL